MYPAPLELLGYSGTIGVHMAEFKLRCSDEEYEGYKVCASLAGLTFSAWVREACQIHAQPPVTTVEDGVVYEPVVPGELPVPQVFKAGSGEVVDTREFLRPGIRKPMSIVAPGKPSDADEAECPSTGLPAWFCLCPDHLRASADKRNRSEYKAPEWKP